MHASLLGLLLGLLVIPACGGDAVGGNASDAQVPDVDGAPGPDVVVLPVSTPVVDTDQDRCYDRTQCGVCPVADLSGQDAQYRGRQPSYQDNGDGTVTDLVTGLMWQKTPGPKLAYAAAVAGAAGFELAGHTDWRLPTIKELYSLIRFSGTDPSGCSTVASCTMTPFIDETVFDFAYGDTTAGERVIDSQYATSTTYVGLTMGGDETVFGVNFADGRIKGYGLTINGQDKTFVVMHVRGPSGYGVNDLEDRGDGTVADHATGLEWLQGDSGHHGAGAAADGALRWAEALAFCEDLAFAGHDDWRLPDAKELQGIVDYTRSPSTSGSPAIDPVFQVTPITDEGGGENYPFYWTSTTHAAHADAPVTGGAAVYVAFGEALGWMQDPNGTYQLLDVHGAGAQRSDPKTGDPADYPHGNGPQGDVIRIYNFARCVRGGAVTFAAAGTGAECPAPGDPVVDCAEAAPGEPCCGDGACAGAENETTCAADCGGTVGPSTCVEQADCEGAGACPPEVTLGCECSATPQGESLCIPRCETAEDCPSPPDVTLTCSPDGLCVPAAP